MKSFTSSSRASKQKGQWDCRIKIYLKQRKNKNKIDLKKIKRKKGRTTAIKSKYQTGRQGQLWWLSESAATEVLRIAPVGQQFIP